MTDGPIPTTLQLVPEKDMKVNLQVPKDKQGREFLFRQLASYFTMVLKEWDLTLLRRDAEVKESYQGKQAYAAMVQARENMRPLFKKLEKFDLPDSIVEPVVEIVHAAQERRYVDANDGYLRLSIGKAAWPIGVTMVGIHERSAREKLHESDKNAAHIMSDEMMFELCADQMAANRSVAAYGLRQHVKSLNIHRPIQSTSTFPCPVRETSLGYFHLEFLQAAMERHCCSGVALSSSRVHVRGKSRA